MSAISTDPKGHEVLVGLTLDETAEFMAHRRAFERGERDGGNRERHLELHDKHERARLEVLGTEIFLRNEKPPIQ
jgi:hypothetical protein